MSRNLPVRIWSPREMDYHLPEAAPQNPPAWILEGESLRERSNKLAEQVMVLGPLFESRRAEENYIPMVLKVKTDERATAKSHQVPVEKLLNLPQNRNVIGMVGDTGDLVLKIDTPRDLTAIKDKISDTQKHAHALSAVLSLEQFSPSVELPSDNTLAIKIKLHDFQSEALNQSAHSYLSKKCKALGLTPSIHHYTESVTIFSLKIWDRDRIVELTKTGAIFSVAPMPLYSHATPSNVGTEEIPAIPFDANADYPTLGILDTGIAPIPQLREWVLSDSYSAYTESDIHRAHGTFVAGRALYADALHGKDFVGAKGIRLFDALVFPGKSKTIPEPDLIANINFAIKANPDIPVWCMSLGLLDECDRDRFSDFADFLDTIQEKYSIVIVKAAGNSLAFIKGAPRQRIFQSAESVRALVVGSIAHEAHPHDLAEIDHASPFSPTGYAPALIVKPDLVHYGGNARVENGKGVATGVPSLSTDGRIITDCGTSFSTPVVAAIVADLHHKVENPSPELLKAMVIHSATHPENIRHTPEERMMLLGYGIPKSVENILYNDEDEITLILEDTLIDGTSRSILDFPYPKMMLEDGSYYGQITATLVTKPILDISRGAEYCQTEVSVRLGTYKDKMIQTIGGKIRNRYKGTEKKNLLLPEFRGKSKKKDRTERYLIAHGDKYQPIKKWSTDLSLFSPKNREKYLTETRGWYLDVGAVYRPTAAVMTPGGRPGIEYCLIITIRDPNKKGKLYDDSTKLLEELNFAHSEIKMRARVTVPVR